MIDIDDLKDEIEIEDVLLEAGAVMGARNGDEQAVFCPFHPNTRTPAGSVNHRKQLYTCYSCGSGGDIISLAKLHLDTEDTHEAIEWLHQEFL